jgi:hypothetical protein
LAQNDPQRFSGKMLALTGHNWVPFTLNQLFTILILSASSLVIIWMRSSATL